MSPASPALFLPAGPVANSSGRLSPALINRLWNEVSLLARVKGRTPHSARHALGVHLVKKTGNPAPPSGSSGTTTPPPPNRLAFQNSVPDRLAFFSGICSS
jgi:integrase